jgi:competence protein ComEA
MNFEILKNKVALTFFAIGAISLSVGGYDAWKAQTNKSSKIDKNPDIKQYQSISKDIKNSQAASNSSDSTTKAAASKTIKIDVSGAVNFPSVYDLNSNSRISDALDSAGGIDNKKADLGWVARNINLATQLNDGDKIYIPTKNDVLPKALSVSSPTVLGVGVTQGALGYQQVVQPSQVASQNPAPNSIATISNQSSSKISINSASEKELDTLPGIGEVTAQKIIQGRPYTSIEELKNKKIVKPTVYEKIKDLIAI